MPVLNIEMIEGRTREQKRMLVDRVTTAVCESLGVDRGTVDVRIWELRRDSTARGGRLLSDPEEPAAPRG